MDLGKRFPVSSIVTREFDHHIRIPVPTSDGGWLISFQDNSEVIILDAQLNEIQRIKLFKAQSKQFSSKFVNLSQDGQWFAISEQTELRITDLQGLIRHRFSHKPWKFYAGSDCYFDSENRLWTVWPGDNPGTDDRLMLFEPISGRVLCEEIIKNDIGVFYISPGPYKHSVMIDVGCGQDGSFIYMAQLTDNSLAIREYEFYDRIISNGGIAPNGEEFVTGAHDGNALMVHSFPSGQIITSLDGETIFANDILTSEEPDQIEYQAIFLDQDHIIVRTRIGRLVLIRRADMQLMGTVWPTGYKIDAMDSRGEPTTDPKMIVDYSGDLTSIHPAGPNKLLAVFDERSAICLLDITTLLACE